MSHSPLLETIPSPLTRSLVCCPLLLPLSSLLSTHFRHPATSESTLELQRYQTLLHTPYIFYHHHNHHVYLYLLPLLRPHPRRGHVACCLLAITKGCRSQKRCKSTLSRITVSIHCLTLRLHPTDSVRLLFGVARYLRLA